MDEPTFEHPSLGTLVFAGKYNWWTCNTDIRPECSISFRVSTWTGTDAKIESRELLDRAADYIDWVRKSEAAVRHQIAEQLTGAYNDFWSDDSLPLTSEQVLDRIVPTSVELHPDGSSYWYCSDGGLFDGHIIEVRIDVNRSITEVLIAG